MRKPFYLVTKHAARMTAIFAILLSAIGLSSLSLNLVLSRGNATEALSHFVQNWTWFITPAGTVLPLLLFSAFCFTVTLSGFERRNWKRLRGKQTASFIRLFRVFRVTQRSKSSVQNLAD